MARRQATSEALDHEHNCDEPDGFPTSRFLQVGSGLGTSVLVVGESLAPNGWRKSGRAFYTLDGKLLPSGRNLNELLGEFGLSIEMCGFTDLVKCYVGSSERLLRECGRKCWPIFERQVVEMQFTLIILLGAKTLSILNDAVQTSFTIGELATFSIGGQDRYLLPLYHTSPINASNRSKNKAIMERWAPDLRRIFAGLL